MNSFLSTAQSLSASGRIPDPKPPRQRAGVQAWYPYYAGYSEKFARAFLQADWVLPEAVVLDPWNGAGTTTLVAQAEGLRSIGTDLNPVAAIVAAAKSARVRDARHVLGIVEESQNQVPRLDGVGDPLAVWLPLPVAAEARQLIETTRQMLCRTEDGYLLDPSTESIPPLAAFIMLATMRACGDLANTRKGSNPAWVRPGEAGTATAADFRAAVQDNLKAMAIDLSGLVDGPVPRIEIASATALPLDERSVDLVLSSPPYCTRLDYVVSTSLELAVLGFGYRGERYDALRRQMTGTPLSRGRELPEPRREWGAEVNAVLSSIREHPSPDSGHYYFKTYWQYFEDMWCSLKEIKRVIRPGGGALLVVQSSYYKGVQVDLPRLVESLGIVVGAQADVVASFDVSRVMTTMNTRARKYASKRTYSESVVALQF